MKKQNVIDIEPKKVKIVCDVPENIIETINTFRIASTEFSNNSQFFNAYFIFYLSIADNMPSSQILYFSQMEDIKRNNFSFYLSASVYQRLELMALSNLRPVKNQAMHMVFSIYYYIKRFHLKSIDL